MHNFSFESLSPYLATAGCKNWIELGKSERLLLLERAAPETVPLIEMYGTTVNKLVRYALLPVDDPSRVEGGAHAFLEQLSLITRLIQAHVDISDTWAGVIADKYPLGDWATGISGVTREDTTVATWQLVCDPSQSPGMLRVLVSLKESQHSASGPELNRHVEESLSFEVPDSAMLTLSARWAFVRELFPDFDRRHVLAYLRAHPLTKSFMTRFEEQCKV